MKIIRAVKEVLILTTILVITPIAAYIHCVLWPVVRIPYDLWMMAGEGEE